MYKLKQILPYIFIGIISASFLLLFSRTLSPLYHTEGADSSVFKMMGQAILHGKTPYVDIFDHKGPMLYAIEALGQWLIPGRLGLFLLQVLAFIPAMLYLYHSSRYFLGAWKSIVVILLTLLTYYFYIEFHSEGGNLCEDWNLPFIAISYGACISIMFRKGTLKRMILYSVLIGICFGCSFLIRPNDAVALIGGPVFGVFMWFLYTREYKHLLYYVLCVITATIVIFSPFFIYFTVHNAIQQAWYGMFVFNSLYSNGIYGMFIACFKMPKLAYVPFLSAIICYAFLSQEKKMLFLLSPTVFFAYLLLGQTGYPHYWIAWVPVLFYSFWLLAFVQKDMRITILAFIIYLSLPVFDSTNWLKTPVRMLNEVKNELQVYDEFVQTESLFSELSLEQKDSIWAYNCTWEGEDNPPNTFNVLLKNNIVPSNRVPLIFMATVDTSLIIDMDITNFRPNYLLVSEQNRKPSSYNIVDSLYIQGNYTVYRTCEQPRMILYKKNNK